MRWIAISPLLFGISACGSPTDLPLAEMNRLAVDHFNSGGKDLFEETLPGAIATARTEGDDTVVIEVLNVPTGKQIVDPTLFTREFRKAFCSKDYMAKWLESGLRIRIEIRSDWGVEFPVMHLATCAG